MKKRVLSLVLTGVLAIGLLAGCSKKEESKDDLLSQIKAKGEMTIAMEGCWAPWTYHDESNALVGFDVEVSAEIAKYLGVEPKYAEGEWDGLLAGVAVGRYDIMANGVGYSEARAESYYFTEPYAYNKTVLIVRSDNEEIKSLEDLNGKITCNSANSTYQVTAESYGATVKDLETLDMTLEEVLAGRADATLNAEVSFHDYMKEHPDAQLKGVAYDPEVERVCIIMPKNDNSKSLQEEINKALDEMRKNGKLAEISIKYFGVDITKE